MSESIRLEIASRNGLKLLAGFCVAFVLFQLCGEMLNSGRGEAGVVVCLVVLAALLVAERLWFGLEPGQALRDLGFGRPRAAGLGAAFLITVLLLAIAPLYALVRGSRFVVEPDWMLLLPGLFAQAGLAEEALFRGYLFRHLRQGRSFWRAAWLAMTPFVVVHLLLFATLPWPTALASLALSAAISPPLARLFEFGGGTIWGPALLHTVIQATPKLVGFPDDPSFVLVWIAASALLPYLVFLRR